METVLYLIGATLLVVPSSSLVRGRHRLVTLSHVLENSSFFPHFLTPLNVSDGLRAWLGTALICHEGRSGVLPFFLVGIILGLGVLLQHCFVRDGDDSLPAPTAYLAGMVLGFLPPFNAAIALVVAVTMALALRQLYAFHLAGAVCILVGGLVMGAPRLEVALMTLLFCLPVAVALLSRRSLELRVKHVRHGRHEGAFHSPVRDVAIPASGREGIHKS
ncbi:hypothetical protein Ga0100231_003025 [Opitutaceae bacterium TAV4]|nr:hypothetical protein Ga0100231_003025 [Opitutaceae bacterium TAV4]